MITHHARRLWRQGRGLALGALAGLLVAAPGQAASPQNPWDLCAAFTRQAEQALDLPPYLLQAISKVESGRWDKDKAALSAWPWTVMAEGRGRYLPSKTAAIAEVKALKAKGVRNIDVGCMQINLHFHPKAFESLEQAFDPAHNVAYGATFLKQLRRQSYSWTRAIGRYHSSTPALMGRYRLKVFRAWREERHLAEQRRRAAAQLARNGGTPAGLLAPVSARIAPGPAASSAATSRQ